MHLSDPVLQAICRRTFLSQARMGLGSAALWSLLRDESTSAESLPDGGSRGIVQPLHHPPRAKRVIFLCQAGGPSHLETFDYKPKLAEMDGQPMPESFTKGQPIAQLQNNELRCLAPQRSFKKYGQSGQMISDVFPHTGKLVDELCIVRSAQTNQINHDPAHTFMNTGTQISGRPSMGSWLTYGLGSESDNLPGFVVMTSVGGGQSQPIAARQWHSGFLPSRYQGVQFRSAGDPVLYVSRPRGVAAGPQRDVLAAVTELNRLREATTGDPEIETRIAQYELAFRMQRSVPELMDISDEPAHILDLYGTAGGDGSFAANCLLARRLAERGVRFIQLYHRGWDHHGGVKDGVAKTAGPRRSGNGGFTYGFETTRYAQRYRSSSGAVNLAGPRWPRAMVAITTSRAFPSGWPGEEFGAECPGVQQTNSVIMRLTTSSTCTIYMPPCCIFSASIISD